MDKNYQRMTKAQLLGVIKGLRRAQSRLAGAGASAQRTAKARSGRSRRSTQSKQDNKATPETQPRRSLKRLVEELQVHQEEIRIQNRELVESQRMLEESRDRYVDLYDFAPVGYVTICSRGMIREVNLTGADLLGIVRERLIGTPFISRVAVSSRRAFIDHLRRCRTGGFPVRTEIVLKGLHGQEERGIPVELASSCAPGATAVQTRYRTAIIDISDRRRAEEERQRLVEVAASERLTRTVLEALPVGVQVVDASGETLLCNRAAERIWGVEAGHLGRYWESGRGRWHPAAEAEPRAHDAEPDGQELSLEEWPIQRALAGGEAVFNELIDIRAFDQSDKTIYVSAIPLWQDDGSITGAVAVMEDITRAKEHERELRQAKEEAETANRIKDQFLAIVSHELRTPLSSILLWVHLLKNGLDNEEERRAAIETIEHAAKAQSDLVNDLLDISRIIVGKLRLELQAGAVTPVVMAAIRAVRPAADEKSVRIESELGAPQEGDVARIDPQRLQQVVGNLLSNAVKFTPAGGSVKVKLESRWGRVRIIVVDNGAGIAPAFLPHVFDRFRQAESAMTRRHGGLGLGLAIARQLVEMHGGHIRADSAGEGRGATFTVELPLANAGPMQVSPKPAISSGNGDDNRDAETGQRLLGLRVLLVEDERDMRVALERILREAGAEVTAVSGVKAAREALRQAIPHVLLSDIAMPDEDGYSLIREVRAMDTARTPDQRKLSDVPAVALTAHARGEDRHKALEAGFQAHLTKPVEAGELVQTITRVVGRGGR